MRSGVFLFDDKGKPIRMTEEPYDSEDLLQRFLSEHPDLLAGDQVNESEPRRWLLIRREAGIPDSAGGGQRWAVDHLFLDQDGVPTLIEVKRSSNPEIRRQVVGQLLEYAANATIYWPVENIEAEFTARCTQDGLVPSEVVREFLGDTDDEAAFWETVKTNLRAGKIRLVIAADHIPDELQRIVEYLNEQMQSAEVLALEVRQFAGGGRKAFVPRVMGQTARTRARKQTTQVEKKTPWTVEEAIQKLRDSGRDDEVPRLEKLAAWARGQGMTIQGGRGGKFSSFNFLLKGPKGEFAPLSFYEGSPNALVHLVFQKMGPVGADKQQREAMCRSLNELEGVQVNPDMQYPGVSMAVLDSAAGDRFLKELESVVSQLKRDD